MENKIHEEIIRTFDQSLSEKYLPSLQELLPLCLSSIANFHFVITTIAQKAIKELLEILATHNMDYAMALKQGIIEIIFPILISRFNSLLELDHPFLVVMVQKKDRSGVCLKATYRKNIPGLRESTHTNIVPLIVIDKLTPGPLLNFKTETFEYLNYQDKDLPEDPTT